MNDDLRSLVEYRLDEAHESIEEAVLLLHDGKPRGALSRAYYAMFYATLALLAIKELGASKHSGVIRLFHEHYVQDGTFEKEIARSLSVAFDLRNKSDYRELISPSREEAQDTLEAAKKFVAEAERVVAQR
ncbi:MAG: HEPN domain-containing protein [Actinobacteria bacterium]|nr:HEPN domain-containing protein [Actinomycetota bacterium]